jgi:hypothetical protein
MPATATFLFRQFFMTIPDELAEAARIDGAGPIRFFIDVVLPLSKTHMAALFVILFIYGWNQYLWPLLITASESMYTVVIGIKRMIAGGDASNEWHLIMATAMLALMPPAMVVILMQKWFVKGWSRPKVGIQGTQSMAEISLHGVTKASARQVIPDQAHRRRRVRRHGGPVGLRKVDAAAHDRGPGDHDRRRDPHRGQARERGRAQGPEHRHGVPELRALPAHERL